METKDLKAPLDDKYKMKFLENSRKKVYKKIKPAIKKINSTMTMDEIRDLLNSRASNVSLSQDIINERNSE